MGGDSRQHVHHLRHTRFQSTPPHGGRPKIRILDSLQPCFNPRPRMGGDITYMESARVLDVSIHAPAWGATYCGCICEPGKCVSIHAPAWGATQTPQTPDHAHQFQSTPPHGGRPSSTILRPCVLFVSIHAPAWGATYSDWRRCGEWFVSIHAPAWGATMIFFS